MPMEDKTVEKEKKEREAAAAKKLDTALTIGSGLLGLGGGLADIFSEPEYESTGGGSIPSGSSPGAINAPPVGQPFSGRMQLSPDQRQSLALALMGRMA